MYIQPPEPCAQLKPELRVLEPPESPDMITALLNVAEHPAFLSAFAFASTALAFLQVTG